MKKQLFLLLFAGSFMLPLYAHAFTFNPNNIISDSTFTDSLSMNVTAIQDFLTNGFLATYSTIDFAGNEKQASEIIYESSQRYGINPKVLIVLLQKEQGLITDDDPTQKQLDWATGYAVCDNCSLSDPRVLRWQGFGKQVNSAAAQFMEGYFADMEEQGVTYGKYGPGIPITISGQTIIPENKATASLYAYTPHIAGNRLFASLWDQWFAVHHPEGTLIKAPERAEVYYIQHGQKRHITSFSVLASRFDESLITLVSQSTIDGIPTGSPIKYPNYSLLLVDGGRYLITDDTIRPFDSEETFRRLGFQEEELIKATYADLDSYTFGDTITKYTQYPTGRLVKVKESGSYYYLEDGYRYYIFPDMLKMQFKRYPVLSVSANEIGQLRDGGFTPIGNGYLVKEKDNNKVYLISESMKRPIDTPETLSAFGWSTEDILTIDSELLRLHKEGDPITEIL